MIEKLDDEADMRERMAQHNKLASAIGMALVNGVRDPSDRVILVESLLVGVIKVIGLSDEIEAEIVDTVAEGAKQRLRAFKRQEEYNA